MIKDFARTQSQKIVKYIQNTFQPEDRILKRVRLDAQSERLPTIQVGQMDGLHLEIIARAAGARKIVEIGTLGGYSGIFLARAIGPKGKLYTCELNPHHATVAKKAFRRAKLEKRVEILVGPALETLAKIQSKGPFDLVFIDADKENYPNYLRWAEKNLKVGGVLLADNTFAFGMVADRKISDPDDKAAVQGIRTLNRTLASGGRFRATLLPTGEGLTFAVKVR